MPPVDIAGLKPNLDEDVDSEDDAGPGQDCNPPLTRVPRGRPRKLRLDKDNYRASRGVRTDDMLEGGPMPAVKRVVYCSTCRKPGHYARTCRRPHN